MPTRNNKPKVSIVKEGDPYRRTLLALHLLDEIEVSPQSKVLVKFNLAPFFQFSQNSRIDPCRVATLQDCVLDNTIEVILFRKMIYCHINYD